MIRALKLVPVLPLLLALFLPRQAVADDSDWPKEFKVEKGKVVVYQPQPETFDGNKLTSRAAISVTLPGSKDPVFGAIWSEARVHTDRDERTVTLEAIKITNIKFPEKVDSAKIAKLKEFIAAEVMKLDLEISLDDLLATLEEQKSMLNAAGIKNDPPEIILRREPSSLVTIDGEPRLEKIEKSGLQRIVNTPFTLVLETASKTYYLALGEKWFSTADLMGKWAYVPKPPEEIRKLEEALKKSQAGKAAAPKDTSKTIPEIIVRTKPAELIQSTGEPSFTPIQGTELLYMSNSDDNVFMQIKTQAYFILLAGRWYTGPKLDGPWKFVRSDSLPPDFAKIPEGSEKDVVLASVAGTKAAQEAKLDAQIPQTAVVDRKKAKCEVKYDGEPKFEKVEGTSMHYAVNTSSSVLLIDKKYYVCDNAVWFIGNSPTGPWEVATEVPKEVQDIPASNPIFNVKYVYIYETTPEVVYVGYTPGYVGCYVAGPTIVYGTGYYYPAWYGAYYYPRPVTYGFSFHYNPYYGWSMGMSVSGPYGSISIHGGGWYGPPMHYPPYHHPYHGYYGNRPMPHGGYGAYGGNPGNIYNNRGEGTRPSTQPSGGRGNGGRGGGNTPSQQPAGGGRGNPPSQQPPGGGRGPSASTQPATGGGKNNVLTDKQGNVYKNNGGDWQRNNGSGWQSQDKSGNRAGASQSDLSRQQANRDRGAQRSNNASSVNRSSGASRPSGGGGRGGGGGGRRR
jgi:hypothetical protein